MSPNPFIYHHGDFITLGAVWTGVAILVAWLAATYRGTVPIFLGIAIPTIIFMFQVFDIMEWELMP